MRWASAIVVVLALLLVGCGGAANDQDSARQTSSATSASSSATTNSGVPTVTIEASGGKEVEVQAEIADSPAEQEVGLMNRKSMGEDHGMLFVFPDEQMRSFWMKDTLIPLSIAYIDSDRRIIDIQDMKPLDDEPPHYVSAGPAQYALEVNKGFFAEHGVEVGDKIKLPE